MVIEVHTQLFPSSPINLRITDIRYIAQLTFENVVSCSGCICYRIAIKWMDKKWYTQYIRRLFKSYMTMLVERRVPISMHVYLDAEVHQHFGLGSVIYGGMTTVTCY